MCLHSPYTTSLHVNLTAKFSDINFANKIQIRVVTLGRDASVFIPGMEGAEEYPARNTQTEGKMDWSHFA
jgi:hypothetical protein